MSVFGSIVSAIFHHSVGSAPAQGAPLAPANPAASGTPADAPASSSVPQFSGLIDAEAVLTKLAAASSEHLDWRKSIVDLMKLLNLDSSLTARKELAHELHYTGDTNDSATMNIWLHTQVMQKLAEHGGKVSADLMQS